MGQLQPSVLFKFCKSAVGDSQIKPRRWCGFLPHVNRLHYLLAYKWKQPVDEANGYKSIGGHNGPNKKRKHILCITSMTIDNMCTVYSISNLYPIAPYRVGYAYRIIFLMEVK
jgi:hypothetical protein